MISMAITPITRLIGYEYINFIQILVINLFYWAQKYMIINFGVNSKF